MRTAEAIDFCSDENDKKNLLGHIPALLGAALNAQLNSNTIEMRAITNGIVDRFMPVMHYYDQCSIEAAVKNLSPLATEQAKNLRSFAAHNALRCIAPALVDNGYADDPQVLLKFLKSPGVVTLVIRAEAYAYNCTNAKDRDYHLNDVKFIQNITRTARTATSARFNEQDRQQLINHMSAALIRMAGDMKDVSDTDAMKALTYKGFVC